MRRPQDRRRRPAVQITVGRAARLRRFVKLLSQEPRSRDEAQQALGIGLRTFYRELDLVKRCGIKVHRKGRTYALVTTPEEAEGSLPFPDPQLSFAEMAELSRHPGAAAHRLADLLARVTRHTTASRRAENARDPREAARVGT